MTDVRRKLATGEPLDFLAYVSTLVAALDPRAENPFERASREPAVTLPELIGSLADVELPETTALLAALAVLLLMSSARPGQGAAGRQGQPARGARLARPA